ncbi:porin [Rubritalea spongiae]|uniref:Porin n=1 Tax=Rubritalea spongiae TaxID=430797 RepID=A0ABW5DZ32_9BACT
MDNKVVTTILGAAALTGSAFAGEVMTPVEETGAIFKAKQKETVEVRFNGRLQMQYDALQGERKESGVETDLNSTNHFYFRRLFFGAKVKLQNGWYGETVFDFAGDENPEVAFDKAYIGYKTNDAFDLKLGFVKVPWGYEETSSSSSIPTIERSAANRFFADDLDFAARHTGVHVGGDLGGGFSYATSLTNSAQGEGSRLGGDAAADNDIAAFGRLQWEANDFLVGADYGHQWNNLVTGDNMQAWTAYATYDVAGFNILGEYFGAGMADAGDSTGYAVRVSYRYDKWEPVYRWSYLENDEFEIDTDELIRRAPVTKVTGPDSEIQSHYFGLNYHHSKAVKFMAGYEHAWAENGAKDQKDMIGGFRARVQLLW